jgi:hypothetical protein
MVNRNSFLNSKNRKSSCSVRTIEIEDTIESDQEFASMATVEDRAKRVLLQLVALDSDSGLD